MSNLPAYRKTMGAILGTLATWGLAASPDGIQAAEWWGLVAAFATMLTVYGVKNEPSPTDAERGASTLVVVLIVVLVLIALGVLR